jgi:hypothetical protein
MMKKFILVAATGLSLLALTACSASSSSNSSKSSSAKSSSTATSKFTQAIYDSITAASTNFDASGNLTYSGGTDYATIEAQVGKPSTSSETTINNQATVTATWSDINFGGKSQTVIIQYDKSSGQITSKNMSTF